MHLASRLNLFGFSFEPILAFRSNTFWLPVRMRLGFLFERVSYNDQTSDRARPGCGANVFIRGANELGQKMRYTLYLTGIVYDVPALINLMISNFSLIFNTTFLCLKFSAILHTSLQYYSIDNVATAHGQPS